MNALCVGLSVIALSLAACGDSSGTANEPAAGPDTAPAMEMSPSTTPEPGSEPTAKPAATGTTITLRNSEFGRMLFNTKRQAIYIFQRDARNRSNCYGECARLWPPVYTKGKPRAVNGVKQALLGTTKRRGGRLQVTYAGKPLYYYAHEGPGEVKCHNVNLNGGLWWVIGPNGKRRA